MEILKEISNPILFLTHTPQAGFVSVGVEPYGGGLWYSWLDRDLGIAGRVLVRSPGGALTHSLVSVARPVLRIPSLAIHMNREVNSEGLKLNAQQHLAPLLATSSGADAAAAAAAVAAPPGGGGGAASAAAGEAMPALAKPAAPAPAPPPPPPPPLTPSERHPPLLLSLIAEQLGCAPTDIADFDLQLTDTQPAVLGGLLSEFVLSGRLDNLASCYTSLTAFVASCSGGPDGSGTLGGEAAVRMVAHFDHEEVGSASAHGAGSPCMLDAIRRVASALAAGQEGAAERSLQASFLVSADMAHAQARIFFVSFSSFFSLALLIYSPLPPRSTRTTRTSTSPPTRRACTAAWW